MTDPSELEAEHSMILVMGVTGSGKSYFINRLAAGATPEGHTLISGKSTTEAACKNLTATRNRRMPDCPTPSWPEICCRRGHAWPG
jgi:ABC-type lipoprotein export system ATPase subunit